MMNRAQISRYLDGELTAEAAEAFERRLVRSPELQQQLEELLMLDATASALAETARELGTALPGYGDETGEEEPGVIERISLPGWLVTPRHAVAACTLLIALLIGSIYFVIQDPYAGVKAYFSGLRRGYTAVRVSYPPADVHRPYDPYLSEVDGIGKPPPGDVLVTLEKSKTFRGIAAAYLLSGSPTLAEQYLVRAALEEATPDENLSLETLEQLRDRPPPFRDLIPAVRNALSPNILSDLGAVAIATGRHEEARRLLLQALSGAPEHPQASWNLGLAYEGLRDEARAVEAFSRVAARSEPGWSQEATGRIRRLRGEGS